MKTLLMYLLLAAIPHWLSTAVAVCDEALETKSASYIVDSEGDGHVVFVSCGDKEGDDCEKHVIRTMATAGADDGRSESTVYALGDRKLQFQTQIKMADGEQGWLGVSISEVPEEVAEEFDIDGGGIYVLDVVGDGPAQKAGIRAKDVILSLDGTKVEGDLNAAIELIKSHGPGESMNVVLLRDGQVEDFTVELGTRPGKVKIRKIGEAGDTARDSGWLGVSIEKVSDALAKQLDIDDEGVVVLNVVADSPADKAGLKVHDVIVSIGNDKVKADVAQAVELIKAHKPGEKVDLYVLRDGEENDLTVTLGSRSELVDLDWTTDFKAAPLAEIEEQIKTRGKFMKRGPEGEWIIKDLGKLELLEDLPEKIQKFLPKSGTKSTQIYVDSGTRKIKTKVEQNGDVISIEQDDDGEITVKRIDDDGDERVTVYADADELRASDEEAAEFFDDAGKSITLQIGVDGITDLEDLDFDFDSDADEWQKHMHDWQSHLDESLSKASEAYEQAMQEYERIMEEWKESGGANKLRGLLHEDKGPLHWFGTHDLGKPRHTFETLEDGTIEVRIRKGDSELLRRFQDEDDLAHRNPQLYEKYEELMEADEDAE